MKISTLHKFSCNIFAFTYAALLAYWMYIIHKTGSASSYLEKYAAYAVCGIFITSNIVKLYRLWKMRKTV